RKQDAEARPSRPAVAVDNPAMVTHYLGDESEPQPRAVGLRGDERVEEYRHQLRRNAGAVVLDGDLQRQRDALRDTLNRNADAWPESGGEPDRVLGRVLERVGRVLHEVKEELDQLIAIAVDRRQRGIVVLEESDPPGDAVLREQLHPVEDHVDVDRLALDWPV